MIHEQQNRATRPTASCPTTWTGKTVLGGVILSRPLPVMVSWPASAGGWLCGRPKASNRHHSADARNPWQHRLRYTDRTNVRYSA